MKLTLKEILLLIIVGFLSLLFAISLLPMELWEWIDGIENQSIVLDGGASGSSHNDIYAILKWDSDSSYCKLNKKFGTVTYLGNDRWIDVIHKLRQLGYQSNGVVVWREIK